jgi:hypothetical protein
MRDESDQKNLNPNQPLSAPFDQLYRDNLGLVSVR